MLEAFAKLNAPLKILWFRCRELKKKKIEIKLMEIDEEKVEFFEINIDPNSLFKALIEQMDLNRNKRRENE